MDGLPAYRDFGVALAAGLLIGVERGWRLRGEEPGKRVAGVRTFGLVGALGGASAIIGQKLHPLVPLSIVVGAVAMLVIAHVRAIEGPGEVSATSLVAVLLALTFGLIAGAGLPAFAMAGAAVTTLVLSLRTELHGLVARLGEADIKALARFAIIAGAILPFLPNERFGPYDAWNPFQLWIVVVLVTGFSLAGYVANRVFGVKRGTLVTAVIGGMYSSTAVTAGLSHRLREEPEAVTTLSAGIALASAVSLARVIILTFLLAQFAAPNLTCLVAPGAVIAATLGLLLARRSLPLAAPTTTHSPVELLPALGFSMLVAAMALAARWAEQTYGGMGLATLTLIVGAFDIDAAIVTLGGLSANSIDGKTAGLILTMAVIANMLVKISVVVLYAGWKRGRAAIGALGASTFVLMALAAIQAMRSGLIT